MAPSQTRSCHPSKSLRLGQSLEVVPGPAGPSCCPTLAQHSPGAPWSAFWAMSCRHSQPLSPPLLCPHPCPLPWLAKAIVPPLMPCPGALLPGSPPSFSFPHWEHLDLRTSVPGETLASPAFPITPADFQNLLWALSPAFQPLFLPVSAPSMHPALLIQHTQLATPLHPFDCCSSPPLWHCCSHSPSVCSALPLSPWE